MDTTSVICNALEELCVTGDRLEEFGLLGDRCISYHPLSHPPTASRLTPAVPFQKPEQRRRHARPWLVNDDHPYGRGVFEVVR